EHTNWICTKCRVSPFKFLGTIDEGETEPLPVFERAELECTYEMVPYLADIADSDIDPATTGETARYVTWPGYPGADVIAEASYVGLPGGVVHYATTTGSTSTGPAGTPVPFAVGFAEGTKRLKAIWRRVPEVAWQPTSDLFARVIGDETTRGMIGSLN